MAEPSLDYADATSSRLNASIFTPNEENKIMIVRQEIIH